MSLGAALVALLAGCSSSIGLEKEPEYDDTAADSSGDSAADTGESAGETATDSAGETAVDDTAGEETGDSTPPDTGETGETGDTAPPPDVVWTLDEYGTRWTGYPASTSVHAPTSAIEAAFAVEDVGKIWVVTRYTWHVMVAETLEWIDSGDRDALFPEVHGLGVSVAASVPAFWGGTTTADVYLLVGDQAYLYFYDTTANRFSFNAQAPLGAEWGDPGAPDPTTLTAGWLAVDEEAGWTEIGSPRATCGADADTLSAYLALTTTTGQAYVYDAGYCADFVGSIASDRLAPFLLPGAPDPDAAAAMDWTGQALVVFAE